MSLGRERNRERMRLHRVAGVAQDSVQPTERLEALELEVAELRQTLHYLQQRVAEMTRTVDSLSPPPYWVN